MKYTLEHNPYIRSIRLDPVGKHGTWRIRVKFHALREIQKKVSLEGEDISSVRDIRDSILDRLEFIADTLDRLNGIKTKIRKEDPIRFRAVNVEEEDIAAVYAGLVMADFLDYADLYEEMEDAEDSIAEMEESAWIAPLATPELKGKVIPFHRPPAEKKQKDPSSKNNNSSKQK